MVMHKLKTAGTGQSTSQSHLPILRTCMLLQLVTASTHGAACVDCRIIGAPGGNGSRGAITTAGCVVYTAPTSFHADVDML
jgi:hypothetical protein